MRRVGGHLPSGSYQVLPKPPYAITEHFIRVGLPGLPTPGLYANGSYRRLVALRDGWVALKVRVKSEGWSPKLEVRVFSDRDGLLETGLELAKHIFAVDMYYRGLLELAGSTPCLEALVRRRAGLRPPRAVNLYEALFGTIIEQNIRLRTALKLQARIIEDLGVRVEVGGEAYHDLPEPSLVADAERLRGYGLSRMKAEALAVVAEMAAGDSLPKNEEVWGDPEGTVERLMRIRGVGRWTAELAVAKVSKNLWIGPAGDLAVRKGLLRVCGGGASEGEVRRLTGPYGPYRGLVMYLLALEGH